MMADLARSLAGDGEGAIFSLRGLCFARGRRAIFAGLNFSLFPGQSIGLYAPNGSGKTTLFRCVTGLERPQKGEVLFMGRPVRTEKDFHALRLQVGFVLQEAEDQLFFPTVREDMLFGPLNQGLTEKEAAARADWALGLLGIGHLADRLCHTLSGGEKKLAALCAMLAMRPRALLLDEPANGLDAAARERLAEALPGLDCARIIVAHERDFIDRLCPECMTLRRGRLEPV